MKVAENRSPYIVIGSGRSGTSNVARILHEKMGIHMGDVFPPSDTVNPGGYYEDMEFWKLNKSFIRGLTNYPNWFVGVSNLITARAKKGIPWGFKENRTSYLLGLLPVFCDGMKIIRCNRDPELVMKSCMEKWGHSEHEAESYYYGRNWAIDRLMRHFDHLLIDYGKDRLEDDEIIERIRGKWNS